MRGPGLSAWRARAGVLVWSHLLALACVLLLLPAQALAGAREKLAALAPSGLVLVMDEKGNELVVQNADKPLVPASVAKIVTAWLAMEVLIGRIGDRSLGSFHYRNRLKRGGAVTCEVHVYPMDVRRQRRHWPEKRHRRCSRSQSMGRPTFFARDGTTKHPARVWSKS